MDLFHRFSRQLDVPAPNSTPALAFMFPVFRECGLRCRAGCQPAGFRTINVVG